MTKWLGITAIKNERIHIHFSSELLVAIASLDRKVHTLLILFHFIQFVQCWEILLELILKDGRHKRL